MKKSKKSKSKLDPSVHGLFLKVAEAEERLEAARLRGRDAKALFKQARKAIKAAKKALRKARKEAKAAAKGPRKTAKTKTGRRNAPKEPAPKLRQQAALRRRPGKPAVSPPAGLNARPADADMGKA